MKRRKYAVLRSSMILLTILLISLLTACKDEEETVVSADEIYVEVEPSEEAMTVDADNTEEIIRESGENVGPEETFSKVENENGGKQEDTTARSVDHASESSAGTDTSAAALSMPDPAQQVTAEATQQPGTSSGSSYEQIFNEYKQKLTDYYNTAKGELQSEVSSGKNIDALAASCSNKVNRLAEISTEGVNKMADLCVKRGGSDGDYVNYGTKLEGVYMDYGTKLESVYMSGAMNSQTKAVEDAMKDLGLSSNISGQYSEEMNKAMDQYNNELNKAMDDYNSQVQDMLKQYGF